MKSKENRYNRRDKKRHNRRHGMRITNRSVFTNQAVQVKKSEEAKKESSK